MTDPAPINARRAEDKGRWTATAWWCVKRASEFWDFIDNRDIDKHAASVFVMIGTWRLTEWAMAYAAAYHTKSGVEIAAIIAAVTAPYMALQAAVLAFYFKARQ